MKPNLAGIQAFDATIWVKDLKANKLESHAKVRRFVGYDEESKGFRVYYPEKWSVGIERDVRFNPDEVLIPEGNIGSKGEWHLPVSDPTIDNNAEIGTSDPVEDEISDSEDKDYPVQAKHPSS